MNQWRYNKLEQKEFIMLVSAGILTMILARLNLDRKDILSIAFFDLGLITVALILNIGVIR